MREERHPAAVGLGAEQPEVRLDQLVQEPQPQEDPGRDPDQEDREDPGPDPGTGIQHEVGAQHRGDGPAGPQFRHLRVGGRAEQQGRPGLRQHGYEAAGKVEQQVGQRPEGVLDILAEDGQEQHVAQDVVPAAVQEHGGDPADPPRLGSPAGVVHGARVKRRMVDRRVQVGQFVEEEHGKVGHDQQDVDHGEPPRRQAIG